MRSKASRMTGSIALRRHVLQDRWKLDWLKPG